jgi:uncharacterized protein (TIRG00374 family)
LSAARSAPAEEPDSEAGSGLHLVRHGVLLGIAGVSLYLLAPTLIEVFTEWPQLGEIEPVWFAVMAVFQTAALVCGIAIQRLTLRTKRWFAVATSNLAGGALGRVMPGGGAAAATLQYGMLVRSGFEAPRVASGLTTASLLIFAALLVLPVLAVPFVLLGRTTISDRLTSALLLGAALFVALGAAAGVLLGSKRALGGVGRFSGRVRDRLRRRQAAGSDLSALLLKERLSILEVLGDHWLRAVLYTVGRWLLELFTLMAALAAAGSRPSLIPVLIAYCAAQLLAQIPITPGGLGFVEAGLTATLALAGVDPADAVLATLAYRLFSFWLPIPAGAIAAVAHRRRFGSA